MKRATILTISLVVLFFIPFITKGAIVINEVLYDPDGVDSSKEYIRLYNNGTEAVDLTNWDLDPSSAPYYTFPSFTLSAQSFVTIHINTSGTNTNTDLYDGESTNMSNTKGPVALFNNTAHSQSTIIDYIEYGAGGQTNESKAVSAGIWTAGNFIPDVEAGKSIKLKTDGVDNNSSSDWMENEPTLQEEPEEPAPPEGPPGGEVPPAVAGNQLPIPNAGKNIIGFIGQEIKFDGTKSSDPDGNELAYSWNMGDGKLIEEPSFTYKYLYPGTYLVTLMVYDGRNYVSDIITVKIQSQEITISEFIPNPEGKDEENEWIEIYNDSDSIVDISGWQLDDEDGGSKPFVFPKNTLIAPKNYLVFPRQITKIALNNDKDKVRLLLSEGVVFQEVDYEKPKQGMSSAQTPEGFVWGLPTPGMPNLVGMAITEEINGQVTYQQPIESETTKESSQDYSWYYQSDFDRRIEGGYLARRSETEAAATSPREASEKEIVEKAPEKQFAKEESQLAAAKESFSKQSPFNLILIIVAITLGAFAIGLSLVKFRKKFP